MSAACLLCGSATNEALAHVRDNRFGSPGEWTILHCPVCALEQTEPLPTLAQLKSLYEQHYNYGGEKGTSYTNWRERFLMGPLYQLMLAVDGDISFHAQKGSGRLLDIGCNEGRGLTLYQRNGFTPEGLELNSVAAAAARARGFTVHEADLSEFRPAHPFDRVVLSNVLEHALNPRAMLADVHRLLVPGGEVWISLPNSQSWMRKIFGRDWINWHVPFHITHFSETRLAMLLDEAGFDVVSRRQITPALWVAQTVIAKIFSGAPDQPQQLRQPVLVAWLMLVARGLCWPLLWLANVTGHGDCLVLKARKR
jgi:2-polyprenyl-3-methyl-5-hydroxy-6-metoxy-1,4-benzoquinol methylase